MPRKLGYNWLLFLRVGKQQLGEGKRFLSRQVFWVWELGKGGSTGWRQANHSVWHNYTCALGETRALGKSSDVADGENQ